MKMSTVRRPVWTRLLPHPIQRAGLRRNGEARLRRPERRFQDEAIARRTDRLLSRMVPFQHLTQTSEAVEKCTRGHSLVLNGWTSKIVFAHAVPMLALATPSSELLPYVEAYWCVRDTYGAQRGCPIETSPRPGGILTVNLGRPNRTADGTPTPVLSLLGVQTQARTWHSDEETHFAMALLSPAGVARLAPGSGAVMADAFLDLGALVGDAASAALLDDASARPDTIAAALDEWLRERLLVRSERPEAHLTDAACAVLARAGRVDAAAERLGISRRHLSRVVSDHLGIGPKALVGLHRFDRSLRAVQAGGNGASGFADQAHQVREWRRRLGTTPGRYARVGRSALAEAFDSATSGSALYL